MRTFFFSLLQRICFLWLSLVITNSLYAQSTSKKATKHYETAAEAIKKRDFDKGMEFLQKAVDEDPNFFEAHYSLAGNHKVLGNAEKAKYHFRKAADLRPNSASLVDLYLEVAEYDMQEGNYVKAKAGYEKIIAFNPPKQKALVLTKRRLANCDYAIENIKKPLNFSPKPLSNNINAKPLQYFPIFSGDEQEVIFIGRNGHQRGMDENLLTSTKDANGNWLPAQEIAEINSPYNEGTCTMSADGKTLIFTSCIGNPDRPVLGDCDLFISYKTGDKWSKPVNMGTGVNSPNWDSQPSLSADGRTLYFISNRSGGYGSNDIWFCSLQNDGKWSAPKNIGLPVNTAGSELAPFIHANGSTLYFASDAQIGFGGYDLFKTELSPEGKWKQAQNLGYPINNHLNQVGLFVTPDSKRGYYSEEKMEGFYITSSIINVFEMPQEIKPETISKYVKGTVYNAQTKEKIQAKIDLYNLKNEVVEASVQSDSKTGNYLFVLNEGQEYALNANKAGYLFQSLSFDYTDKANNEPAIVDIYLEPVAKGSKVTLNNIFFESAKWDILEKSKTELKLVAKFLSENPTLKIEISGHTDDVGGDTANQKLSEMRAKSVSEYLVSTGIATERIITKGYGETKPKVPNTSDQNRATNRRIEFLIL